MWDRQGPSDYPGFVKFPVEQGVDKISVTPDSILKTINAIAGIEKAIESKQYPERKPVRPPADRNAVNYCNDCCQ